jgi:hypothetical protein
VEGQQQQVLAQRPRVCHQSVGQVGQPVGGVQLVAVGDAAQQVDVQLSQQA